MEDRLTAAQLDAVEARAKAATPDPWEKGVDDTGGPFTGWPSVVAPSADISVVHRAGFKQEYWGDLSRQQANANADFIAAARTDIPALLRDLRAAREALEVCAAQFEHYERLHREKRTTDDNLKALVNWGFAQFARAALPEETPSGE